MKEKNKNEKEEISLDNLINNIIEEEKENNEENIVIDTPKKGQNVNDYLTRKVKNTEDYKLDINKVDSKHIGKYTYKVKLGKITKKRNS